MKLSPEKQKQQIQYWLTVAEKDLPVMEHLFASGDFHYALFIGHLIIEKLLKGLYVKSTAEIPPFKHNLILLAKKMKLALTEEQKRDFETFNDFNIEARYPDDKFDFFKLCTREFTQSNIKKIEETYQWLRTLILS